MPEMGWEPQWTQHLDVGFAGALLSDPPPKPHLSLLKCRGARVKASACTPITLDFVVKHSEHLMGPF